MIFQPRPSPLKYSTIRAEYSMWRRLTIPTVLAITRLPALAAASWVTITWLAPPKTIEDMKNTTSGSSPASTPRTP